ncbi:MAG: hypothetical protein KC776_28875 [Myxococcales bacterium]|nr:hypothetical protein [Myxococcales bacterium]MCB9580960.1 hypothetical protein [Polyangiaceae bacterium]
MAPHDALREAQRAEELERWRLPLMFGGLLALILMSRFDATRALAAGLFTFGFPVVAAAVGALRYRESDTGLRSLAITAAALGAVAAEAALGRAILTDSPLFAALPATLPIAPALGVAVILGAVAQAVAKTRGMRSFLAAWLGMVMVWGLYVPTHRVGGHDALDAMLGAAIVALFVGGGGGLLAGFVASLFVKRRDAD